MKVPKLIKLDINKQIYDNIIAKQGDSARYLLFRLLDNGVPFSLEEKTLKVYGVKPDGKLIFNNITIVDIKRGLVELQLTTQMLAIPGTLKLELTIHENGEIFSTLPFEIEVVKSIRDDKAIESTNEFSALTRGLLKLDEWDKIFEETTGKIEEKYTERLNNVSSHLDTKALQSDLIVERNRITNLATLESGSTTGDAELIDGRVGADGIVYSNIGGAIRNQIKKINDTIETSNILTSYINLLSEGEMKDISKFNGSNLTQEEQGIRAISDKATTLLSTKNGVFINEKDYCFIISFECDSNVNFNIEGYNGSYYFRRNVNRTAGSYDLVFQLSRIKDGTASGVRIFINSLSACNILIRKMMFISLEGTTLEELREIYNTVGFFTEYNVKNFYNKDEVKEEIEKKLGNVNKTLYAYSDTSVSGENIDDNTNIFIGSVDNKNAIERAIDTVRGVQGQKITVICVGEFTSNSFDDMLSNDRYGRSYKSYISFNDTYNVRLLGLGNNTKIEILLPDQSDIKYSDYQIVNFDGINPTIENIKIIGQNMRYVIHADTTGSNNYNYGSSHLLKNCEIKHIKQETNANSSWTSPSALGLGISNGMTFTIDNCILRGVQSDIVGHDSASPSDYEFNIIDSKFSMATGTAFNWRLFGTSSNYKKYNAKYKFIGNSFGDKKIYLTLSNSEVEFYPQVSGYGNSIRFITNYNYLFSNEYEIRKAYNNPIIKNSIVDAYGNYSNGLLYGLAIDDVDSGSEVRVITRGIVKISDIRVKENEILKGGDYVTAENGLVKKSDITTRWSVFELWGTLYLRIE